MTLLAEATLRGTRPSARGLFRLNADEHWLTVANHSKRQLPPNLHHTVIYIADFRQMSTAHGASTNRHQRPCCLLQRSLITATSLMLRRTQPWALQSRCAGGY